MKEKTRNKILDVVLQLCREYGFWSVRVEDIVKYSHISRATFYNYFKSKEDVLFAVLEKETKKVVFRIEKALKEEPNPYKKLRIYLKLEIAGTREAFQALNIHFSEITILPAIPKENIEKKNKNDIKIVKDILFDGVNKGFFVLEDLDVTAQIVVGMKMEIWRSAMMENKESETVEKEIDILLNILFFGFSKK